MSSGSNPATTTGTRWRATKASKMPQPVIAAACPAAMNPSMRESGISHTISSTSWAVFPSLLFTIAARSTTTGPVTSITMRALPGADWPPRNDLTRPTAASPGCDGSCSMTSGSSTKTRLGLVSEKTWNSTERSSPMMNLVRA